MGSTMGTGNVHSDDVETLQFADESEYGYEPHDDAYAPSIADEPNAADPVLAPHRHDLIESGMTDECKYGCKIFRCRCGKQEIRHMASYGCQIGKAELAAAQAASEPTDLIEVQEYLTGELPEDYCPQCEIALVLHPDGLTCDGDRPVVDRRINPS